MKLENLTVGMIIKNYRELCRVLEVDIKTGGAKQNQIEWFEEYFSYTKDGHKFIVTEVLDMEVEPMSDNRGGDTSDNTYIELIEKLILDLLVQDGEKGKIFLSKSQLFKKLEMVNANYSECKSRVPKLSKFMDIDKDNVQEWYNSTSGMLERNLNRALKKLEGQSLIFWTKEITVCIVNPMLSTAQVQRETKVDRYGEEFEEYHGNVGTAKVYREATEDEKRFILTIEREVMEELKCKNKQEIIKKGLWDTFGNKVKSIIFREHNIAFYWQSYKIIFNTTHILARSKELNKILLSKGQRVEYKTILNTSISDRSNRNTVNRHEKAKVDADYLFGTSPDLKIKRRVEDSYVENGEALVSTLINKNHKNITKQVRETMLS